ncbi:hypothetical protein [Spiroplasma taiwanense]|uniref:Holliday junction DNA helicase RuvA C-terminal domain-containing protein n=1 Tax=Spiroplasma taiwanense CT-1 TaxID=1276220 RepID=S5LWX6_9MOLU|nr:hypothetical protein [Spiroplasma taiwanense]AGR41136.1 hypothetical protein STAIW_v1c04950 [Spiroplasma taiwanense CT-1]
MNIINSLNRLGYRISDIYKAIDGIDINFKEEIILEMAIRKLNSYEK